MARYEFRAPGSRVRIVDPAIEGGVGVRIEHDSGAALIVPSVIGERTQVGLRFDIVGFDGTHFVIELPDDRSQVSIRAEPTSPILGGRDQIIAARTPEHEKASGPVRVTGDETTMPIAVDDE